jgi:hypothetical protein
MIQELKRGVTILLNNEKEEVIMKVYETHLDI